MQLLWCVGAIRIHFTQNLVILLQTPLKASDISAQQAALALAVQHVKVGVLRCQLVGCLAGAIRGVIVNDEDVNLRRGFTHAAGNQRQVLNLIVGGDNDQGGFAGRAH